jgi:hypothetical protein
MSKKKVRGSENVKVWRKGGRGCDMGRSAALFLFY